MCGINGITQGHQTDRITKMMEYTKRRGPDGSSTYTDDRITLGHNLLAIYAKPEDSKQPFILRDSVLVFNGAIYNYKELDEWNCQSNTDTEVLAHGLEKYGMEFLKRCNGMWAFAWYDKKDGKTYLCRDHFGVKPIYYKRIKTGLMFSSSWRALENKNNYLNMFSYSMYKAFGYVPGYLTLIKDVYKVTPGEYMVWNHRKEILTRGSLYKDWQLNTNQKWDEEEFQHMLKQAIDQSSVGIREKGLFLSGGLDSASIMPVSYTHLTLPTICSV